MRGKVRIEGHSVFLKSLGEEDVTKKYCKWLNDKEVNKYLGAGNKRNTIKSLHKYVREKIEKKDCIFLGIFHKETGNHIGNIKLEPIDFDNKKATVGIMIGDKSYWRKGYGTEAMKTILDYCFSALDLNKVALGVLTENIPAIKVYKKVGFQPEGILRENFIKHGKKYDSLIMSILRKDYAKS